MTEKEQSDSPEKFAFDGETDSTSAKQDAAPESRSPDAGSPVRQFADQISGWLKDANPELHTAISPAIFTAAGLADSGLDNAKMAAGMLTEFVNDLIGVESFSIIPKSTLALEVDIHAKQEQDIPVNQNLAPFVQLRDLHFARRINLEALINQEEKGLQLDFREGMKLKISVPLIGVQTVPVQGTVLLRYDAAHQLVMVLTTMVPSVNHPVTVTIPIKQLLQAAQLPWAKKGFGLKF